MKLDCSLFPLVQQVLTSGGNEREAVETLIEDYRRLFQLGRRFALLVLAADDHAVPDALSRRRFCEWEKTDAVWIARYNLGTALVVRSAVQRGALTAMNWFRTPCCPQMVVGSELEGAEWCLGRLQQEVPLTPQMRAYRARLRWREDAQGRPHGVAPEQV
jgi:hypothetical protein